MGGSFAYMFIICWNRVHNLYVVPIFKNQIKSFFLLSTMLKVAPAELEALLLTHPEIEDAAVVS